MHVGENHLQGSRSAQVGEFFGTVWSSVVTFLTCGFFFNRISPNGRIESNADDESVSQVFGSSSRDSVRRAESLKKANSACSTPRSMATAVCTVDPRQEQQEDEVRTGCDVGACEV